MAETIEDNVIVYQAFTDKIADYAVENQSFSGGFSFKRMGWIKPSFLWLMNKSRWGTLEDQSKILRVSVPRNFFDRCVYSGVEAQYQKKFGDYKQWKQRLKKSDVIIQHDSDGDMYGNKLLEKAIQIGLRRGELRRYSDQIQSIEDMTERVHNLDKERTFTSSDLNLPRLRRYELR